MSIKLSGSLTCTGGFIFTRAQGYIPISVNAIDVVSIEETVTTVEATFILDPPDFIGPIDLFWEQIDGPAVVIDSPTSAITTVTMPFGDTERIRLRVYIDKGLPTEISDNMTIFREYTELAIGGFPVNDNSQQGYYMIPTYISTSRDLALAPSNIKIGRSSIPDPWDPDTPVTLLPVTNDPWYVLSWNTLPNNVFVGFDEDDKQVIKIEHHVYEYGNDVPIAVIPADPMATSESYVFKDTGKKYYVGTVYDTDGYSGDQSRIVMYAPEILVSANPAPLSEANAQRLTLTDFGSGGITLNDDYSNTEITRIQFGVQYDQQDDVIVGGGIVLNSNYVDITVIRNNSSVVNKQEFNVGGTVIGSSTITSHIIERANGISIGV